IFRPDDFSLVASTFVDLLGLPRIVAPGTLVNGASQQTGASPFCNSVRPAFVLPAPAPTCLQGADATWDPTSKNVPAGCNRETAVYRATMQDNDPIRRACVNATSGTLSVGEDVCSHSGDLGLVLPINQVPESSPRTNIDRYNANPCIRRMASVTTPEV